MTTESELDEILRRAMHAAVDSVEPAGDGLQQIRRQLARPRLRLQAGLLLIETVDLVRLIGIRLQPAASWAAGLLGRLWAAAAAAVSQPAASSGPARRGAAHRSRPPGRIAGAIAWLRPAIAVGAAVVIVVAGVFTLFTLRATISPISLLTGGGSQSPAAGVPARTGTGQGGTPRATPAAARSAPPAKGKSSTRHRAAPRPSCTPGATAGPPLSSPSPTAAPSPTGTPTAPPSPTGTASASPSQSAAAASSAPPAGLGGGGAPVQLTSGCYGTRKTGAGTVTVSPTP
jgi:hypothetical protein